MPEEDALSGGSNRLTYILLGLIIALVVGYIALPKAPGDALAAVTPAAMLDNATVTATAPAAADKAKTETKAADDATTEEDNAKPTRKVAKTTVAATTPGAVVAAPEPAATAAATEVAAAEPVAVAEPAAPANVTVTGRMEDENGKPLVGATVLLKGSSKGTSTDANGSYSLEVPNGSDNSLIYGYGGYEDEVVRVSGSKPVNVILTPRAKASRHRR